MHVSRGQPFIREGLFGGRGKVQVWDLLAGKMLAPFTAVLACELDPDGHVGRHRQAQWPEIVVVLEGEGGARVGDVEHQLAPGVVVHLPCGQTLELRNTSQTEPLRYLIVKSAG